MHRPTPIKSLSKSPPVQGVSRLLAGMRIRKKLVILHTCFSLVMAGALALAIRPAVREVVTQAEQHEAGMLVEVVLAERRRLASAAQEGEVGPPEPVQETVRRIGAQLGATARLEAGTAEQLGLSTADLAQARERGGNGAALVSARKSDGSAGGTWAGAVAVDPVRVADEPVLIAASVELAGARGAVVKLYLLLMAALLGVYVLVALALEVFVLPQHVYGPLRTMLEADAALQEGRETDEIIPDAAMPSDEMGEIMRSRNESVRTMRKHETDLAEALRRLEEVATDLRRKNHLLEMARRNLADADRLASLGMMSAGIAHELNTPLAVLKGMVEKLHETVIRGGGSSMSAGETALMLRVVERLERLSESLLDFARVRPNRAVATTLAPVIEEAWMLVRLDRDAKRVTFTNTAPADLTAFCDPDRIVQVLVNLLRNAVDALDGKEPARSPRIDVGGQRLERDGKTWAALTIADTGPGIDPETLEKLFQPFVSTRLDAKGTGLGLAVAYGIIREHGGVILARNRADGVTGAVFEVLLPEAERPAAADHSDGPSDRPAGVLPAR